MAVALGCMLVSYLPSLQAADEWPQFRGPTGDGNVRSARLPITWSETNNVRWKTPIHGRAWSSPVIWGNQIWVTTATEDGRVLSAICVDRDSGKIVHDIRLFNVEKPQFAHKFNTYGSPTPVIESGRVYVTFGSPGTACLDTKTGKVLWERRDFVCNHYRGAGSSPVLHRNLLLMNYDGSDHQYVAALDKRTGKTVWKVDRSIDFKDLVDGKPEAEGDWRKGFGTPHVATVQGKPMLISQGAKAIYGYEPATGKELWRVEERTAHSASTRPVFAGGRVIFPTGWSKGTILSINPSFGGEVVDANSEELQSGNLKVVWKSKRSVPNKPSLQPVDGLIFTIDDGGVASCLDQETGAVIWNERVGGNFSASPIASEGRVYFFNEEGKT
ncbi:MAG: quinonprotein alcohol dehydrogenase, partial [Verrucomicrobia bacterium]|nr:quinonprotein alcohol dehydrogenase [Verrucomicrobiota bacterium]